MTGNARQDIERIYRAWDEALGKKDLEAALSLYAEGASIESPLVQHLLKQPGGIVRGKDNLRAFVTKVFETNPPQRKRFKQGFFTDGRVLTWEYPRTAPDGEQMDPAPPRLLGLVRAERAAGGPSISSAPALRIPLRQFPDPC
jgi:SnoaL-like domain